MSHQSTPQRQVNTVAAAAATLSPPAALSSHHHLQPSSPAFNTRSRSRSPSPSPSPQPRSATKPPPSPSRALSESLEKLQLAPSLALPPSASSSVSVAPPSVPPSRTGLVYDPRCLLHQCNYAHVEAPARAGRSIELLKERGLYQRCVHVPARVASTEEIVGVAHTQAHVADIDKTASYEYGPDEPDSETEGDETLYPDCKYLDSDTYVNRHSALAARLSIGGLIDLSERVLNGSLANGFAVVRPPGHHADTTKAQGFCLYNTVAVAAAEMRRKYRERLKRILIVDWDVHHGNGTQNIFYDDPHVLYFSIHRYQNGMFYPRTGSKEEVGTGAGTGFNVNVPLNFTRLGDEEYMEVFRRVLLPIVDDYQPQLIYVSAGFDCAAGDPLGGMEVSTEGFAIMTQMLRNSVKHGRVVLALEGGYNVRAVSEAVTACVRVLLGEHPDPLVDDGRTTFMSKREIAKVAQKRDLFRKDLQQCIKIQAKYWKSLRRQISEEEERKIAEERRKATRPEPAPATTIAPPSTAMPAPVPVTTSVPAPSAKPAVLRPPSTSSPLSPVSAASTVSLVVTPAAQVNVRVGSQSASASSSPSPLVASQSSASASSSLTSTVAPNHSNPTHSTMQ